MKFLAPITDLFRSTRAGIYKFTLELLNGSVEFNTYYKDKEKLTAALSNPALLKVISLQCDLFSLGEIYIKDKNGEYIESDPFLDWIKKPNPMQTKQQFLWDWMFWEMLGNAYMYIDSRNLASPNNYSYLLTPHKIDFPTSLERDKDKLIFSKSKLDEIKKKQITYYYDDGTKFQFPLGKLLLSTDLTNGIGNYYKGASKIDALYKIISNSEYSLDTKNINLRYAGKFMVGAENSSEKIGLTDDEKEDIKTKMDTDDRKVYPMSSMAKIQRFVEDFGRLQLNESYMNDYFLIGNMYNIPRDVLEAYVSATYENQEKARGAHVSYTLSPKGNELMNHLEYYFGYSDKDLNICMDWSHLPFMQVFEKDKAEMLNQKASALATMVQNGISLEEARKLLDLEL